VSKRQCARRKPHTSLSSRPIRRWISAALLGLVSTACAGGSGQPPDPALAALDVPTMGNPDELLIVDCLLPAQVKKLGSQLTYLAPRRPVKTSASDCEIRGGEYVAYDRANYQTALQVWRPLADQGDAEAQTYVGEIYEKGLGVAPDYGLAAAWYRKAADQGYGPAQINLGQLFEKGLGVTKNQEVALDWYRKASGLADLDTEFIAFRNDTKAKQQLESRLARSDRELGELKQQLVAAQHKLAEARELQTQAIGFDPEAERAQLMKDAQALRRERIDLEHERQELEASRPDPAAARARAAELDRRAAEIASRENAVEQGERALEEKQKKLAGLEDTIHDLEKQAEQSREKVLTLAKADESGVPGPTIQLVDPSLVKTRGQGTGAVMVPVSGHEHTVVGRVEAPAGLLTLMINDTEAKVAKDGFFETRVRVRRSGTQVTVVAVDRQGKRTDREFLLRASTLGEVPSPPQTPAPPPMPERASFGRYYALVIGNQSYQRLPDLDTAHADARAVAEVLKSRYGFTVIPRYDANRFEMLYILNELRNRLTPSDNLLIYYAGHGAIDEANRRGNWLPVDADPKNRANWISNVEITDILNAMQAKHVLVIADSCYSGTLTDTSVAELDADAPAAEIKIWQRTIFEKRSRTALTSGGLAPVLDGGGGGHSVFAKALLAVLSQNADVLSGWQLHEEVAARVRYEAQRQRFEQTPEYAPIKHAGHEAGEFLLVPSA
jgi:uncharacterized caspase-like protein